MSLHNARKQKYTVFAKYDKSYFMHHVARQMLLGIEYTALYVKQK